MNGLIFFTLLVLLVAIVYKFLQWKYNFWLRQGVPHLKPHSWIVGNLRGVGRHNVAEYIGSVYTEIQTQDIFGIAGFYFFTEPALLANDPQLIRLILTKDFEYFHDRGVFVNEKDDPLSAHLFSLEGAKWKRLRMKLTPTFTSGKMKGMFNILLKVSNELSTFLDDELKLNDEFEVRDIFARFTIDIIGSCAFGIECNSLRDESSEFKEIGMQVFGNSQWQMFKIALITAFQNLSRQLGCRFTTMRTEKFFFKIIEETIEYREKNNVRRHDFMDLLLQLKNKGKLDDDKGEAGDLLTFNEIAAQCFVFFLAGFETSSTTMSCCLYELARHQDIQEQLRDHINEVLNRNGNQITYESLSEMSYLDQIINETLRLYPPLTILQRKVVKEYKVPGKDYTLIPGQMLFVPIFSMQRDEKYFPNPYDFNPERFNPSNIDKIKPFSYLPFGEGPRQCIGVRFGMLQTRLGIVTFLRNVRIRECQRTVPVIELSPTSPMLLPKHGIWLKLEKLSDN